MDNDLKFIKLDDGLTFSNWKTTSQFSNRKMKSHFDKYASPVPKENTRCMNNVV